MKTQILSILFMFGVITQASATPLVVAVCDEPRGPRIDYMAHISDPSQPPKLERSEDRSTGVNPSFIIDSAKPNELGWNWGPTKGYGKSPISLKSTGSDKIVIRTEEIIVAVNLHRRKINVTTLLPKLGFMAFTHHSYSTILGDWFEAVTLTAKCKFSR